jgi:shikimate dehydrogenase
MEIGANTRLLAVLGDPVAHSLSPAMHNAAIRALGLDAVYVGLRVHAAALTDVLKALTAVGAAGNVTVPHKEAVERHVARKTDACAKAGACNTFWVDDGVLVGDNTDVAAVRGALAALGAEGTGRWLVIGTGGAARAVAIAAAAAGADLRVRSRAPERAKRFVSWAAEQGTRAAVWKDGEATDVALNATPLGLAQADPLPVDPARLAGVGYALDMVYVAGQTRWVQALRAAGVVAADGREMLVRQGAAAFDRFFPGANATIDVMRAAVSRALRA